MKLLKGIVSVLGGVVLFIAMCVIAVAILKLFGFVLTHLNLSL